MFGLVEWAEREEGWTCAALTPVLFGDRWRRCRGGDGPGRPARSTRFLKALLEMLEGMPACHNSLKRLEREPLWHFIGETGMTFFENWKKTQSHSCYGNRKRWHVWALEAVREGLELDIDMLRKILRVRSAVELQGSTHPSRVWSQLVSG